MAIVKNGLLVNDDGPKKSILEQLDELYAKDANRVELLQKAEENIYRMHQKQLRFQQDVEREIKRAANASAEGFRSQVAALEENFKAEQSEASEAIYSAVKNDIKGIGAEAQRLHRRLLDMKELADSLSQKENDLSEFYTQLLGKTIKRSHVLIASEYEKLSEDEKSKYAESEDGKFCFEEQEVVLGIRDEFKEKAEAIDKQQKEQEKTFKQLHEKINGLINGATNVGLGKSYEDAESSHLDSMNFWNKVLGCSILALALIPLGWEWADRFPAWVSEVKIFGRVLFYMPFELPMILLAFLASKNSNLYRRLAEEYRYKKTLAFTYNGLQTEIDKMLDKEKANMFSERLLEQSLQASGENPSSFVNDAKSDLPIMKMLEIAEKCGEGAIEITKTIGRSKVSVQQKGPDTKDSCSLEAESETNTKETKPAA